MRLKLDKRTGPLYWCTYEKQFTENTFMNGSKKILIG